jgi:heme-degrading monooxygenase HmoA
MVYEICEIHVKEGEEAAFEAAVKEAAPFFQRSKGCLGLELQRTIESTSKYRLIIKWETLDDHIVHFRNSENFQEWRKLAGPFFAQPPHVEHTNVALTAF